MFSVPYAAFVIGTQANANRNESVGQIMRGNGITWRTRAYIDDGTADGDTLALIGLGKGIDGSAIAAFWPGVELVRDNITQAAKGQIQLTASV